MDMDAIAPMAGLVSIEIPALIVLGDVESFIEDGRGGLRAAPAACYTRGVTLRRNTDDMSSWTPNAARHPRIAVQMEEGRHILVAAAFIRAGTHTRQGS
jgi:hypothetical protein